MLDSEPTPVRPARPRSVEAASQLDTEAISVTIHSALAQGPLPRYTDLENLEQLLRRYLTLLLPHAEEAAAPQQLLAGVRGHMQEGMGPGLMSAHLHVRRLACDTRTLLGYVERSGR